jgi:hypothetical protein
MFDLRFQPPQNFAAYRQSEIDNARVPTFGQMMAVPFISNRFALKRFLGLTEEEIAENERLWKEENEDNLEPSPDDADAEMRSAGISDAGIEGDLGGLEDEGADEMGGIDGGDDEGPTSATDEDPMGGGGAGGGQGGPGAGGGAGATP